MEMALKRKKLKLDKIQLEVKNPMRLLKVRPSEMATFSTRNYSLSPTQLCEYKSRAELGQSESFAFQSSPWNKRSQSISGNLIPADS